MCLIRFVLSLGIQKLPPATTMRISLMVKAHQNTGRLITMIKLSTHLNSNSNNCARVAVGGNPTEAHERRATRSIPFRGIHSSAVVAAMADQMTEPVKTFSIGFGARDFDELRYARMVAEQFSTDHHEFQVEPGDMTSIISKLPLHYGEPFADPSAIPVLSRTHRSPCNCRA